MKLTAFFGLALGLAATTSQADTLDFTEVGGSGIIPVTVINLSNATLTSFGDDFFIGAPGQFGEANGLGIACASPAGNGGCESDWQIDFLSDVNNLGMASFGTSSGDSVEVSAFLDGSLLGSVTVTTNTSLDLSGFGTIDSLFFDDTSSAAGIGFGDFSFDKVAAVPLPASLPLLIAALGGVGLMRRRKS